VKGESNFLNRGTREEGGRVRISETPGHLGRGGNLQEGVNRSSSLKAGWEHPCTCARLVLLERPKDNGGHSRGGKKGKLGGVPEEKSRCKVPLILE